MNASELFSRRSDLHAEMKNAPAAKRDTQWFRDRANEMEWLNRQLARLGAIPTPADHDDLADHAAAWQREDDHTADDESWWANNRPARFDDMIPNAEFIAQTSLVGHQP